MEKYYVLYNPLAGNGACEGEAAKLKGLIADKELIFVDMTLIDSYEKFFAEIGTEDIIICGGDGTLNRFINDTAGIIIKNKLYYYASGSGNDFLRDVRFGGNDEMLVSLNKYIENLPQVTVNGKTSYFINGIGFGLDGYCCEEGDNLRAVSDKPVNYAGIAIKGLLGKFKAVNAKVTADGKEYKFKKVWLAPTMKGHFYGGGMNMAPHQDRFSKGVSFVVIHNVSGLGAFCAFPLIFAGKHIKLKHIVKEISANNVSVEFDKPTALQIDGETIKNVTAYSVSCMAKKLAVK